MTKSASPTAFGTERLTAMAIRFPRTGRMVQVTATGPQPARAQPGRDGEMR